MRKVASCSSFAGYTLSVFSLVIIGILGALIGSFANVVIYRLPRSESVAFPGSRCPSCERAIKPWENVPILSWLALRGRCAGCRVAISPRYPLVEALTAAGFVLLALRWPLETYSFSVVPLLTIYAMLVMMSLIDLDHFILPDSLTLPATGVALLGTYVYAADSGLPSPSEALVGAAVGAGILALINRVGSLVLRRLGDTRERLWPIGMDQVNVAALGGAALGWQAGLGLAAGSVVLNLALRRPLRLAEGPLYGLWLLALALSPVNPLVTPVQSLAGTFAAAGCVSVVGALYWWLRDMFTSEETPETPEDDEPVAMGFGDVKLAAILGAMLGWQLMLVGLLLAFIIGAVGGVIGRLAGGDRVIPFGPPLALGGLLALFIGPAILAWYLGMLGL